MESTRKTGIKAARKAGFPRSFINSIKREEDCWWRPSIAKAMKIDSEKAKEWLTILANDKCEDVRWMVGEHPDTPIDILKRLADDKSWRARWGVAENPNPNIPIDILKRLADDEDRRVRWVLAGRPDLPVDILKKLADDEDRTIRLRTAMNSHTPIAILEKLANDEDWRISHEAKAQLNSRA